MTLCDLRISHNPAPPHFSAIGRDFIRCAIAERISMQSAAGSANSGATGDDPGENNCWTILPAMVALR